MSTNAFHNSGSRFHHDRAECPVVAELVDVVLIPGTGGKPRCPECARLSKPDKAA